MGGTGAGGREAEVGGDPGLPSWYAPMAPVPQAPRASRHVNVPSLPNATSFRRDRGDNHRLPCGGPKTPSVSPAREIGNHDRQPPAGLRPAEVMDGCTLFWVVWRGEKTRCVTTGTSETGRDEAEKYPMPGEPSRQPTHFLGGFSRGRVPNRHPTIGIQGERVEAGVGCGSNSTRLMGLVSVEEWMRQGWQAARATDL